MGKYTPHTQEDISAMLQKIGVASIDELYSAVPKDLLLKELNLKEGISEADALRYLKTLADGNNQYSVILRGAGSYDHYIPAVVSELSRRSEFVTAYTPYQAEMSQGILQSIFEYQTMICNILGMDVSNASHYDGATATAEALLMTRERNRYKVIVPSVISEELKRTLETYLLAQDMVICYLDSVDGLMNLDELRREADDTLAGVLVEVPNYYGLLEQVDEISEITHKAGAKLVAKVYPISLGILRKPSDYKADIAVGEGQPLGMPMSFGGAYLGFMATTKAMQRKLPGRIVGETLDKKGNRCYVLTLQAREQHIRREKASSNICSNEALCALKASMYLAVLGERGLKQVATACLNNSHYFASKLTKIGFSLKYGEFFNEFVTVCKTKTDVILSHLDEKNILGGLKISDSEILWCVTEKLNKSDIDNVISIIKEVTLC